MNVPESLPQVLIFIAMLVPGISFVTVRTWFIGWRSPDYGAGSRVLEALYVSAIFVIVYVGLGLVTLGLTSHLTGLATLGSLEVLATGGWRSGPTGWVGFGAVALLVVIPGLVAALTSWSRITTEVDADGGVTHQRRRVNRNQAVPRAWDYSAYGAETPRFVRVKTSTGVYIGGWFDVEGYISTYPYERDIFIAHQWRMSKDGQFLEPIENSLGAWVPINDDTHLEWIALPAPPAQNEDESEIESAR